MKIPKYIALNLLLFLLGILLGDYLLNRTDSETKKNGEAEQIAASESVAVLDMPISVEKTGAKEDVKNKEGKISLSEKEACLLAVKTYLDEIPDIKKIDGFKVMFHRGEKPLSLGYKFAFTLHAFQFSPNKKAVYIPGGEIVIGVSADGSVVKILPSKNER